MNPLHQPLPSAPAALPAPVAPRAPAAAGRPDAAPVLARLWPRGYAVSTLSVYCMALAVFLTLSRAHLSVPGGEAARPTLLLSGLSLVLLAGQTSRWKPNELKSDWVFRTIGVLVLFAILGVPGAVVRGEAFGFLKDLYLKTVLIALMVWAIARTPRGLILMVRVAVAAATVQALLALRAGRFDVGGRLSGSHTYDANDLAMLMVVNIPLVVWWATATKGRFRHLVLLTLPVMMLVLVRTQSRGGQLGLGAVMVGLLFLGTLGGSPRVTRAARRMFVVGVLALPVMPATFWERLRTIGAEEDYNREHETGRIQVWKRGMGYAFDNPVFGVGIGNFRNAEGRLSDVAQSRAAGEGFKWSVAHNSFVEVFAELGLIPGAMFFGTVGLLVVKLLTMARRLRRRPIPLPVEVTTLAPFLGLGMLSFSVSGFFLSLGYSDTLYVLLGLSAATLHAERRARRALKAASGAAPPRAPVPAPGTVPAQRPGGVPAARPRPSAAPRPLPPAPRPR